MIKRIVKMLNVKRSSSPVRTYRRIRTKKSDVEDTSISSSSSSLSDDDDNDGSCLISKRQSTKDNLRGRGARRRVDWEDPEDIIRPKDYKERKILCPTKVVDESTNRQYPCEKKFATKDLPRYAFVRPTRFNLIFVITKIFELGAWNQFLNVRPIMKSTKPRIQDHPVDAFIKGTI